MIHHGCLRTVLRSSPLNTARNVTCKLLNAAFMFLFVLLQCLSITYKNIF